MSRRIPPWLDTEQWLVPVDLTGRLQQHLRSLREQGADASVVAQILRQLHSCGGLQSWRDHEALAEHLLGAGQLDRARVVAQEGLDLLRGKPRMGQPRQDLQQLLARISSRELAREKRRAARSRKADGSTTQPSLPLPPPRAPQPPQPPQPPQSLPQKRPVVDEKAPGDQDLPVALDLTLRPAPALLRSLGSAPDAEEARPLMARRRLALLGTRTAMADRFDHLLSLETMRGVEQMAHQIETVRRVLRVLRVRALLADEVGLGKTIEAAMVLSECLLRGMVTTVLILVPAALVGQWREELLDKFGIQVASTEDPDYRADPQGFWTRHDRILASLEVARRQRHQQVLSQRRHDLVIVDEAHRLKRSSTLGYRLVDSLRSRFLLLLTATPVENDLEELYNIITLLRPGQLSTRAAFRRRFVSRRDPTAPRNAEELRGLLGEVMVRNTRALVDLRLPPRFASTVRCEPTSTEMEIYRRVQEMVAAGYGNTRERLALATLLQEAGSSPRAVAATARRMLERAGLDPALHAQLRPLVNLCRAPVETSKAQRLLELLDAARAGGEKCVVFTRYRQTLAYLEELLEWHGVERVSFSGAMSGADKDAAVRALAERIDVMLATEVGGEGRNLQCASTLVNFDLPWNPMKLEQRIGRLHRIGQTREVRIHNLCAAGSAEDRILDVLDRRINMFELVVGELDMILGQMEDERDFAERVLEIYGTARSDQDLDAGFTRLGDELAAARTQHEGTKQLDQLLFGRDFEV